MNHFDLMSFYLGGAVGVVLTLLTIALNSWLTPRATAHPLTLHTGKKDWKPRSKR